MTSTPISAKWMKSHQIKPVLLSTPLSVDKASSMQDFSLEPYDFSWDSDLQKTWWSRQLNGAEHYKTLWAVRGGYGAGRLLSAFSEEQLQSLFQKKLFIGYSDLTCIHQLYASWNQPSIHGAVLVESLDDNKQAVNFTQIQEIVENHWQGFSNGRWRSLNGQPIKFPDNTRKLTGGNLSILQAMIDTRYDYLQAFDNLFIEDLHVKPYQVDRMLWHLWQSGRLSHVRTLFVGYFDGDSEIMHTLWSSWQKRLRIDILIDERHGHGSYNFPLVFHAPFVLTPEDDAEKNWNIVYQ